MAKEQYIVLRRQSRLVPTAGSLGGRVGARAGGMEPETLEIAEADLSKTERDDLRRDPRTRAIARSMPMKLIEPTASQPVAGAAGENPTWGVTAVRAPESPFNGQGITVAVLDTGIDPNHPAFKEVNLIQKNFTSAADNDLHGHGTHCAGTIFGQDVNNTRIGVARQIDRALIGKVLAPNEGSSATIARAIQWAVNEGAHVISMSLGIDFPGFVKFLVDVENLPVEAATSIALEEYRSNVNLFSELAEFVRAQSAFLQGTVIVAASGNESNRPNFEIAVAPPAAGTDIIAVGALQQSNAGFSIANFSNTQVNISGPGVDVISAALGGGLVSFNGTSMATPHAAGIAALWAQKMLDTTGRVDSQHLMAQLIGSGTREPLVANAEAEDVGTGIVQAPLS